MKKLLTAIAAAVFIIYPCFVSASYIIHLKDGREFATDRYYEEGEQIKFTLTLHKPSVQNRYTRSISGHQETLVHFQDLTVCSIRFHP